MKAWHFTSAKLRDGSPIPAVGETLVHDGPLVMCESGLHASKRAIDALQYAPGNIVHRVEVGGEIIHQNDKLIAMERTILWTLDAEELLGRFARLCALDVIHLWNAPEIVVKFLRGDESLRDAAWDASWGTARAAAWGTARAAAWDAAGAAAWGAAWGAARAAARAASWGTAGAATGAAAWGAAMDATGAAAWGAAGAAAGGAEMDAQNTRLERMLNDAHRKE